MKKWVTILFLMSIAVVLGACSESKANVDLSNYPESVQSGEVSVKFYDDLSAFIESYETVHYGMIYIAETEEKYPDSILLTEYVDAITGMDRSFKNDVKNTKLKPKTEKDKQINQAVKTIISLQEDYNEAMWDKAKNAVYDKETMLFIDRKMITKLYDQLKEEIE